MNDSGWDEERKLEMKGKCYAVGKRDLFQESMAIFCIIIIPFRGNCAHSECSLTHCYKVLLKAGEFHVKMNYKVKG